MSKEITINHNDGVTIKLEHNHEKLTSYGGTYRNSVIDFFKTKCKKFFTNQLDEKNVRAYNTFNNTSKIV